MEQTGDRRRLNTCTNLNVKVMSESELKKVPRLCRTTTSRYYQLQLSKGRICFGPSLLNFPPLDNLYVLTLKVTAIESRLQVAPPSSAPLVGEIFLNEGLASLDQTRTSGVAAKGS